MADSKVTIQIDAEAEGAKRTLADVEAAAERAMDSGANSAQKFKKSLDEVSESAKLSARQIKGVVSGMASMATGVAAAAMKANGREKEASYLGAASSGATQGASMLAPLGPLAMALGALGGAGLGAAKNYFERDAIGKEQREGQVDLADSLAKAREEMERVQARTDTFARMLERLGDVQTNAAEREQWLADEIAERQRQIEEAGERMKKAESDLRANAAQIDGPMTKEQEKAAQAIRDAWAEANKDLQRSQTELDRLKGVKIEQKVEDGNPTRESAQFSNLEKLGIGFNAATDSLAREGNRIAEEQLTCLKQIADLAGTTATFG